jgi:FkbM family methyltransferase
VSVQPSELGGPYQTVLDVGAFRGDFAMACFEQWPDATVLSFEPLEPKPRNLADRGGRWRWYQTALGERPGQVTINRNEFVPSSSILPMAELHRKAFPYTKRATEVIVGIVPLDEFLGLVVEPALLKIDVQGYELNVLRGATEVLPLCTGVVLEVSWAPLYHGAATPERLAELLSAAGFEHRARVDELYHPKSPRTLLQSDEFWARP